MRSSSLSDRALVMISSSGPEFSPRRSPRVYVPGQAVTVRRGLSSERARGEARSACSGFEAVVSSGPMVARRRLRVGLWLVLLILPLAACQQKWEQPNVRDEEMESAFFAGLDTKELADLPEPSRLRPCCVFGHDIGVQIRSVPMPGYEIQNVL